MYRDSDRLLYVLSGKKEMTWTAFKQAFDCLHLTHFENDMESTDLAIKRYKTLRALNSLGHCESDFEADIPRVYVTPTVLARLPLAGLPRAVLTGSRAPQAAEELEKAASAGVEISVRVDEQNKELRMVPTRILVQAESLEKLETFAKKAGITFPENPPAWTLVNMSCSINDYQNSLVWKESEELNWRRKDFDPETLQFGSKREDHQPVKLCSYIDPVRNTSIHYLWKDQKRAVVDRDWGRYLILRHAGQNVLFYDPRRFILAVPSTVSLPCIFARSLALCSGYAAVTVPGMALGEQVVQNVFYDVFRAVPQRIAEMAALKIGQALEAFSAGLELKGEKH